MARKKKETEITDSLDIESVLEGLGDEFNSLDNTEVLTTRKKVRTPVELINCFLGGGLPYGSIVGQFGDPGGGKSTTAYITGSYFLKNEPKGFMVVVDSELSCDPIRLKQFDIDIKRVIRLVPSSIMDGFEKLQLLFERIHSKQEVAGVKIPLYVIWDTLTKGRSEDSETSSRMDAKNRARVIKSKFNDIDQWLEKMDIVFNALYQVIITVDKYGNATTTSGGGVGLKHNEHIRFYIKPPNKKNLDDYGMEKFSISTVNLDKSKISPIITNIPLYIDATNGGSIDEFKSVLYYFYNTGLMVAKGAYYNFNPLFEVLTNIQVPYLKYFLDNYSGGYRWNDILSGLCVMPELYGLLRLSFMDIVGCTYKLQKKVMESYYSKIKQELVDLGVVFELLETKETTLIGEEDSEVTDTTKEVEGGNEVEQ